jgi:hypothetical protein
MVHLPSGVSWIAGLGRTLVAPSNVALFFRRLIKTICLLPTSYEIFPLLVGNNSILDLLKLKKLKIPKKFKISLQPSMRTFPVISIGRCPSGQIKISRRTGSAGT